VDTDDLAVGLPGQLGGEADDAIILGSAVQRDAWRG